MDKPLGAKAVAELEQLVPADAIRGRRSDANQLKHLSGHKLDEKGSDTTAIALMSRKSRRLE